MSWMSTLHQTYDQAIDLTDLAPSDKPIPISHTVQNAHIVIVVDSYGNYRRARVEEKPMRIVLPATEKSAGRSSGEAPHPLADKLQYIAADYKEFGGKKPAYFCSYRDQIQRWAESDFSNASIKAVFKYIDKKSVTADLIEEKILSIDASNRLLTQWTDKEVEPPALFKILPKDKGQLDQGNALVCWEVESVNVVESKTWLDGELQKSWEDFNKQREGNSSLCYVSGEQEPSAQSHPAKLRHSGDKAKLISSNDSLGFTFRGRFTNGLQAASVSSITTQKAHNALRWLIERQGIKNGDPVVVAWAVSGKKIPDPVMKKELDLDDFDSDDVNKQGDDGSTTGQIDETVDLGLIYAEKLNRYMHGYSKDLELNDRVSIMALDSATPGRMAISYYRESMPRDYIDHVTRWHIDFAWPQRIVNDMAQVRGKPSNKTFWAVAAPTPYTILCATYADVIKSNSALKKTIYERLLPCIVEMAPFPQDILNRAIAQAVNLHNKEYCEWERCVSVTCALIKGFYIRQTKTHKSKEFSMALDMTNTSKDYLYGRLLAIADNIESFALYKTGEKRLTNALRLMHRFSDRPYTTWRSIELALQPYIQRLGGHYQAENLDEVMGKFIPDSFCSDVALSGEFLLGFHCQRMELRQSRQKANQQSAGEEQ